MAEQARYVVRTPMWLWLTNGLLASICVIVVAAALVVGNMPPAMLLVVVALASVSMAFWFSMPAYRVGGGRNLIRIYEDRIEVPGVHARQPMVFRRDGLAIDVEAVKVQYRVALTPVATVTRGHVVTFRAGDQTRKLSTLVLQDSHDEPALLADLQRFLGGEAAIGRSGHDAPPPRTEYDDRVDRELSQLD